MKKISIYMYVLIFLICNTVSISANEENVKKREMRAVWITSVYNKDWPRVQDKNNIENQKSDFIKILDDVKGLGFNTVIVQVRPKGDALYKSNINPWSDVLTNKQGKDPGYDPLDFMIKEAHKRNIEIHAWLNPYRVTTSGTDLNILSDNNMAKKNPDWVVASKAGVDIDGKNIYALYYDPGLPEVREYLLDSIEEIVRNYDIDGIHFDDYFYPSKEFDDKDTYEMYGNNLNIDEFRRNSVNELIKNTKIKINTIKPNVKFGISPRGIWKNYSSDPTGSHTSGSESYYDIYSDTRTWIRNGWIDYVTPQLYWKIGYNIADYSKLVNWWNNEVQDKNTDLYIGQGVYKPEISAEIREQINLNRKYKNIKGSMYYTLSDIRENVSGVKDKVNELYKYPAIPPPMKWKDSNPPKTPTMNVDLNNNFNEISINKNSEDSYYYLVYRFDEGESINLEDNSKILADISANESRVVYRDSQATKGKNYIYAVTALDRLHNESSPIIKATNVKKYYLDMFSFYGEDSVKSSMLSLQKETGWYLEYKEIKNESNKYKIITGEFNGEENVIAAVNALKLRTGWWATYERSNNPDKYRIVTGEFNSENSVKSGIERIFNEFGWWATYEKTSENNSEQSLTPKYRVETGEFNNENIAKEAAKTLGLKTGWWTSYEKTNNPGKYRVITGEFIGESNAKKATDIIEREFQWWSKYEATGNFVNNYRLITGDFNTKDIAIEKSEWIKQKYGWHTEVKER